MCRPIRVVVGGSKCYPKLNTLPFDPYVLTELLENMPRWSRRGSDFEENFTIFTKYGDTPSEAQIMSKSVRDGLTRHLGGVLHQKLSRYD